MLSNRHHHHQRIQQQGGSSWRTPAWATSLRERLQPRGRTAPARRASTTASRLVDANRCSWNGAIYRSINRWHNSWTLLDNPVHLDDWMRSPDDTDINGQIRYVQLKITH